MGGTTLVTGATGLLGAQVLSRLVHGGMPVRALVRPGPALVKASAALVDTAVGDYRDEESLARALDGVERVIACVRRRRSEWGATHMEVDGEGTARLVELARQAGVRRFVYVSTLGAELGLQAPAFVAKAHAEEAVRHSGVPFTILRPSVFHPPVLAMARQAFRSQRVVLFGSGQAKVSPVFVGDVADAAVLAAFDDGPSRTEEIGGPQRFTYESLARQVALQVGRPDARVVTVPLGALRLARRVANHFRPGVETTLAFLEEIYSNDFVADNGPLLENFPALQLTSMKEVVRREYVMRLPMAA